jgi:hypothetical protein
VNRSAFWGRNALLCIVQSFLIGILGALDFHRSRWNASRVFGKDGAFCAPFSGILGATARHCGGGTI